jgi:hypothetical protein
MVMRLPFAVILALLSASFGCSSSKDCTDVGCESGAMLTRTVAVTDAEASALVITACRNDACVTGTKSTRAGDQLNPYSIVYAFTGPIPSYAFVAQAASGGHQVELHIGNTESENKNMKDGDVYTITITKPGETSPTLKVTSTASYSTSEPNGAECGPTCKSTSL